MERLYFIAIFLFLMFGSISGLNSMWSWNCEKGACKKKLRTSSTTDTTLSLSACRLFCSDSAALWPKPTGYVSVGTSLEKININGIEFDGIKSDIPISELARAAAKIFKEGVQALIPSNVHPAGGKSLIINLNILYPNISKITLNVDESYTLKVFESSDGRLSVLITAPTVFGARHGLETLGQLIIFDDLKEELQMPRDVTIADNPAYSYRGLLLDTSRNYITVDAIKRTLKAMGASKLNSFHWHITDSHSFPYVSKSHPEFSQFGAYSPSKIYSETDIAEIIEYGKERGVRVIPEFDAPAHVGEGWQNTDLVVCFNIQPWQNYCVEPPCGQFDPTKPELYDVIEDIYRDMIEQFKPDIFHMGGNEVNFNCWNSTDNIVEWMEKVNGWGRTDQDFIKLWNYFQKQALERLYEKAGYEIPVILWTSQLTQKENVLNYLRKDKYIIQISTSGNDEEVTNLLENGYRLILSNYDALYFDSGANGWDSNGKSWYCLYIVWQEVYENKPKKIAGDKKHLILGGEAALWTEQVDSTSIDGHLWPRAAAMAEVFWSEPTTGWEEAEERFLVHRERLVNLGISADAVQPEWCFQNKENCRMDDTFDKETERFNTDNNKFDTNNNKFDTDNNKFDTDNNKFDTNNNKFDIDNNKFDTNNNKFDIDNNKFDTNNNKFNIDNNKFNIDNDKFDIDNNKFNIDNNKFDINNNKFETDHNNFNRDNNKFDTRNGTFNINNDTFGTNNDTLDC